MRTVYIDLTRDETGQRDKINVGYTGEHNATELVMPPTTEQAVVMLASHFYESRDGSTAGFFNDNPNAAKQVWNTVDLLLRLDRRWRV